MTDWTKFEGFDPEEERKPEACEVCEALLPDAVDGVLSEVEQRVFDQHVAGCVNCAMELEEAKRGAAWLGMLKTQTPEPPANLLARILAETTGNLAMEQTRAAMPVMSVAVEEEFELQPTFSLEKPGFFARFKSFFSVENAQRSFQPRMAMTAAMAFFSIALTMNLTGFKMSSLRAENFTPSGMHRQLVDFQASATRTFQNNRVVYQMESRLNDFRSDDATHAPTPESQYGQKPRLSTDNFEVKQ